MQRLYAGILALALVGLGQQATARETSNPHLEKGIKLIGELEYAQAEQLLKRALTWPGASARDRARAHLHLGIIKSNQRNDTAARASFKRALDEDARVELPEMVSPKIQSVFEQVRATHTPPTPTPTPMPTTPPPTDPDDDDDDDDGGGSKSGAWYKSWPAWTVLGVGVVAGAAGIGLGVSSQSEKDKAEDTSIPYNTAMEHSDRSSSRALAANILFATAGAAVITSGVLFYLAHRKAERTTATVVPTRGGLLVGLAIRR